MANILLIEEEQELVDFIERCLVQQQHVVFKAATLQLAIDLFEQQKQVIELLFVNYATMSEGHILLDKLLEQIGSAIPVIIVSDFTEETEIRKALGHIRIHTVMQIPFRKEQLLLHVESGLNGSQSGGASDVKLCNDYLKVPLELLAKEEKTSFDVYIRFSDTKFLKILKVGEALSAERFENYKAKNLQNIYVKKSDHNKTLRESIKAVSTNSKSLPPKQIAKEVRKINKLVIDQIYSDHIDKDIFDASLEVASTNVSTILEHNDLASLLKDLEEIDNDTYRHCIAVNMFSLMLAKKLGWLDQEQLMSISLAALYHDIGHKWIDPQILAKKFSDFSPEEWDKYYQHPINGVEILSQVPEVPPDVLSMILEHHENNIGAGYPVGRKAKDLHLISKLLIITNEYCEMIIKRGQNPVLPPLEAIAKMEGNRKKYEARIFDAFVKIIKPS